MKRLGPGKAGEEREVRHHDHHDKSGQPSRSLGALGLVFILGLAMGAVARGGGPSTGESAVPAATEPWTVSVEPPTASTGSSKASTPAASTPAAAQEAAASDRPCNVDGSGDCGAHGRCYLGWCVCARGWQGRRCDVSDGSPCTMNTAESAAHLDACEATIRRVDEQYKKRSRSRGGATIGRETRGGACGSVLESTDKCAASPTAGAVVVEERRWRLAQAFEAATWRQLASRGQDRDETHLRQYDAYSMIFPRHFERALEIGCGPWTQTRTLLAATGATVGTLTLSDPLLETYIQDVSTCSYKNADTYRRTLAGKRRPAGQAGPAGRPPSYKPEFVIRKLEFAPAGGEDLRPGGGVVVRDATTGATRPFGDQGGYDLVVMINVLEHCRDALSTLQNAFNALKPGGYFVLEDRYADSQWARYERGRSLRFPDRDISQRNWGKQGTPFWDVGHPLQPKRAIYTRLARFFDVLHWRSNLWPNEEHPDEMYFVGRKRADVRDLDADFEWYM
ncbi:unnamed protein product [Pelagomonas calceolata]|uniref:EGF-like domain-containing protein n=1 Tax=Pelagomonas calceolata TaxID=35677 RepID=A0A7S3ZKW1_9STRA|nr:unnamed protein product [Pelagomonas calceolata]|mmetsp:Transcript_2480/g.7493  ORF Transcript_2480/g.7493 Transcript_2480/m.7493 type:complete len:507 (+) Transcript_2480:37-1557(+)